MREGISFKMARGTIMACRDMAYVSQGEDPLEAIARSAIDAISTDLEIEVGGVTMHLAAFMDPAHWEQDWREAGIEDVYEWAAAL